MKDADIRRFIDGERQRLIQYVRSLFRDTAEMDAEDVVHDVLVKMLERPGSTESLSNLTGYVYRAMKNRIIDVARIRKSTVVLDVGTEESTAASAEFLQSLEPSAFEQLQTQEGKTALFEALSRLSTIERDVVIAQEFEGIPFRELSIAWNIPQNTLLSHKARALKKLKGYLSHSE